MTQLSVFVTTFNNAETLDACLTSVQFADEVLVLDSFSTDATPKICEQHGVKFIQNEFLGYGRQKQLALDNTAGDWVLFLDADEMVSDELQRELIELRASGFDRGKYEGYEFPRNEQVFWRMSAATTRKNYYVRLFRRESASFTEMPVHATVDVQGPIRRLNGYFYHFGETDIHLKVTKVNGYSTGLVRDKVEKGRQPNPWIMVFYPPFFFIRSYIFKRGFTNGWAGFIASCVGTFYVFLKYAKLYEHERFEKDGLSHLPQGAPELKTPAQRYSGPV